MKFSIFYKIEGAVGVIDNVPNTENPVESETLSALLKTLANSPLLNPNPSSVYLVRVIGVKIQECPLVISDQKPS